MRGTGLDKLSKFLGVFQRYSSTVVAHINSTFFLVFVGLLDVVVGRGWFAPGITRHFGPPVLRAVYPHTPSVKFLCWFSLEKGISLVRERNIARIRLVCPRKAV